MRCLPFLFLETHVRFDLISRSEIPDSAGLLESLLCQGYLFSVEVYLRLNQCHRRFVLMVRERAATTRQTEEKKQNQDEFHGERGLESPLLRKPFFLRKAHKVCKKEGGFLESPFLIKRRRLFCSCTLSCFFIFFSPLFTLTIEAPGNRPFFLVRSALGKFRQKAVWRLTPKKYF